MIKKIMVGTLVGLALSTGLSAAGNSGFFLRDGDRVVFLGDSITEQQLYTSYIEAYTLTRFPQQSFVFRNAGWSGDTSWLRKRFKTDENALFASQGEAQQKMVSTAVGFGLARDVLPLKPTVVTVDFGMNDGAQPFRPDVFKAYVACQNEIVRVLRQNGARVALLTPQPIEEKRPDPGQDVRNLALRRFSDGLKDVATNGAALYVDQFDPYLALMMKARVGQPNALIGGGHDSVHPGPPGHTLMAWAILKGLGAPALVSSAGLDVRRFGWERKVVQADQCRISKVRYSHGVLSFQRLDAALPMPIDSRAVEALKLAPILDELSRYELKVLGLNADRYDVKVDGEKVATVTRDELEKGWNMAGLPGPVARQTREVLALVFVKNSLFYQRWRQCQLSPDPAVQQKASGFDAQIAAKEAAINAACQPKLHRFELAPLSM